MRAAIIGAGAAGLLAAGESKINTVVFESNEKAGKKLYITGKGRCNFTNNCDTAEFLQNVVSGKKFLYGALNAFSPSDAINLMEANGVKAVTERGNRVFPLSDKASDIIKALKNHAEKNDAEFRLKHKVTAIKKIAEKFVLTVHDLDFNRFYNEEFDKVLICCGGKSYPETGSDGNLNKIIEELGHKIICQAAALTPVLLDKSVKEIEGLSLKNVAVSAKFNGKEIREFGEMVFTDKGMSGPVILSISSQINRLDFKKEKCVISIDLKPALSAEILDKRILSDFEKFKNKLFKNSLDELLPKSLIPYMIKYCGIDPEKPVNSITRQERERLVLSLKELNFTAIGLESINRAIVTAGGVDLKEVSPKTMESKIVKGLYFAGEILDIDALTGGFNIQIALSTGAVAGRNLGENKNVFI